MSTAFGPMLASLSSALAQSIHQDQPLVAVTTSFTPNPTSHHRSHCSKNILNHVAIYVTIIPSIIANCISLSSTGMQQSFDFALLAMQGPF
jgi:hypothetical protein